MPVVPPGLYHQWILFAPVQLQIVKLHFCPFLTFSLIKGLEFLHEGFLVLAGNIFEGIAGLIHNAALNDHFREHTVDRIGETC
jgi:hypothetical protein